MRLSCVACKRPALYLNLHADEEISDSRPSSRLQRRERRVVVVGGGGGPVTFSISISIVAISQKCERAGRAGV